MTPLMYRVLDRTVESSAVVTLELEPVDQAISRPDHGQFTMLWAFGVGEVPISVAGIEPGGSLVHTVRSVGAVTRAICELRPGDEVGVRGPFGTAWPADRVEGADALVVAGGLGLAPLRTTIQHLLTHRDRYRRCVVFVGAREPDALIYKDCLDEWANDDRLEFEVIVDRGDERWRGQVGLITKLITNASLDGARTHAFLCGPEAMMYYGATAAVTAGVPPDQIWVSLERNMHCGVVHCGHCQLGSLFLCKDGPVVSWPRVASLLRVPER